MLVLIRKASRCVENPIGRCCSFTEPLTKALKMMSAQNMQTITSTVSSINVIGCLLWKLHSVLNCCPVLYLHFADLPFVLLVPGCTVFAYSGTAIAVTSQVMGLRRMKSHLLPTATRSHFCMCLSLSLSSQDSQPMDDFLDLPQILQHLWSSIDSRAAKTMYSLSQREKMINSPFLWWQTESGGSHVDQKVPEQHLLLETKFWWEEVMPPKEIAQLLPRA